MRRKLLAIFLLCLAVLWCAQAGAVYKQIKIESTTPLPANTEIQIFDEAGTQVSTTKVDEDGKIAFDFKKGGKYTLKWPGGSQMVSVAGEAVTGGTVALVLFGGGAAALAVDANRDNDTTTAPAAPAGCDHTKTVDIASTSPPDPLG